MGNAEWTLAGYRLAWMPGPFGNGKTAYAMYMYLSFFRPRGYKLVTNISSPYAVPLDEISLDEDGNLHAFILIDEGGQWFQSGKDIYEMLRNPRKMDYILVFPSFIPPAKAAQVLQIQPLYSLRAAGVPWVRMEWRAKIGTYRGSGRWWWSWMQSVWGTYSTKDPSASPADIRLWLLDQNKEYRRRYGYTAEDVIEDLQSFEPHADARAKQSLPTYMENSDYVETEFEPVVNKGKVEVFIQPRK